MTNQHQLADYFVSGNRNRTTRSNEFGRLADKSTAIFSVEITQITESPGKWRNYSNGLSITCD